MDNNIDVIGSLIGEVASKSILLFKIYKMYQEGHIKSFRDITVNEKGQLIIKSDVDVDFHTASEIVEILNGVMGNKDKQMIPSDHDIALFIESFFRKMSNKVEDVSGVSFLEDGETR